MAGLADKLKKKLHVSGKSSSSSSSDDEEMVKVTAILSSDFGPGFKCFAGMACTYSDPTSRPSGAKKMEYKGREFHEKCFACALCKKSMSGSKPFVPKGVEVYCPDCYDEKFLPRCAKCKKMMKHGGVTYDDKPFHKECFTCDHCKKLLAGQSFTTKDGEPYCAECYGEKFAKRCDGCKKPISGVGSATKYVSFKDRQWHNDCFRCTKCKDGLVGKGFIAHESDILCSKCAKKT